MNLNLILCLLLIFSIESIVSRTTSLFEIAKDRRNFTHFRVEDLNNDVEGCGDEEESGSNQSPAVDSFENYVFTKPPGFSGSSNSLLNVSILFVFIRLLFT